MIAPCGMNCAVCSGYLRKDYPCMGCRNMEYKRCVIFKCERLAQTASGFCYECVKFPCRRMRELDARYVNNYNVSLIGNLRQIQAAGIDLFLQSETAKWTCKGCGGTICIHKGYCWQCKLPAKI